MTIFRWLSIAAVILVVALSLSIPVRTELSADRVELTADGRSTARIRSIRETILGTPALGVAPRPRIHNAAELGVVVLPAHDGSAIVRAGHRAGTLHTWAGTARLDLRLALDPRDLDADGLPDSAELLTREDRAAFTAWFTAIAEGQATHIDDAWAPVHQDCAGLVRFAFREALKKHDRRWLAARKYLPAFAAPDVRSMTYPDLPFIGERPFRTRAGSFDPRAPLGAQLTAAASARTLWQHNSVLISRELEDARPGDLLFFSVPHATGSRMHTMIVLGARAGSTPDLPAARVVYHTGTGAGGGAVKLVSIEELLRHPDPGWHPVTHNPRFLGVHRLIHLQHETRRFDHG